MPANLENSPWPQDWKRSVFIPIPKKCNAKECSNYCTIAPISHTSRVMFKILQARFQQFMNDELPDVQHGFRKGRGPEIKSPISVGSSKKWESSRKKNILLLYWLCQSLWLCEPQQTVENSSRDGNTNPLTCLLRHLYAGQEATVRPEHEKKKTGVKSGKDYVKAVYCPPV